ncbi:MAG: phage holin family protein [Steroidobacteraceae bacterium]
MTKFLLRAVVVALGLWAATELLPGFRIDSAGTLVLAAVLLGVCNAIVRPLLVLLTLPITLLTLGLFLLVVNAAVLGLVAALLPGFHIESFGAAFLGALLVGFIGWVGSLIFK